MSKTVTFIADVYPYCVGDVVVLNDDELKQVDKVAKARKRQVYQVGPQAEVTSSSEADRQAAAQAEAKKADAEAKAQAKLAAEEAKKADAALHNSTSGTTTPGTAAGTTVKTADAK
jgi:long-subunit acyl-CoA synthetase (AMP-forming)